MEEAIIALQTSELLVTVGLVVLVCLHLVERGLHCCVPLGSEDDEEVYAAIATIEAGEESQEDRN